MALRSETGVDGFEGLAQRERRSTPQQLSSDSPLLDASTPARARSVSPPSTILAAGSSGWQAAAVSRPRGQLARFVQRRATVLAATLYTLGVAAWAALAFSGTNERTYFSDNSLLPGMVERETRISGDAAQLLDALHTEVGVDRSDYFPSNSRRSVDPLKLPTAWLAGQFRRAGLEVYKHNFSLVYPLGSRSIFYGENLYAILRAARASRTEAIVISAPFRTPASPHGSALPSIAAMIALAKQFRRKLYWSKDIVFVINEFELVGLQAWLDAYHLVETAPGILDPGHLSARSGSIMAAINLEFQDHNIDQVDVKIIGLNGQLPNLDLVNTCRDLLLREGVPFAIEGRNDPDEDSTPLATWHHAAISLFLQMARHATGAPSAGHGLFHRFSIQALTLRGEPRTRDRRPVSLTPLGRVVEGLVRSVNNLLQRFHRSYFYYYLPISDRYVSIAYYMSALGLICAGVLLKAIALLLDLIDDQQLQQRYNQLSLQQQTNQPLASNANLPGCTTVAPAAAAATLLGMSPSGGTYLTLLWRALPLGLAAEAYGAALFSLAGYGEKFVRRVLPLSTQDALYVFTLSMSALPLLVAPFIARRHHRQHHRQQQQMQVLQNSATLPPTIGTQAPLGSNMQQIQLEASLDFTTKKTTRSSSSWGEKRRESISLSDSVSSNAFDGAGAMVAQRLLLQLHLLLILAPLSILNASLATFAAIVAVPVVLTAGAPCQWMPTRIIRALLQLAACPFIATMLLLFGQTLTSDIAVSCDFSWGALIHQAMGATSVEKFQQFLRHVSSMRCQDTDLLVSVLFQALSAHRRLLLFIVEDWHIYGAVTFPLFCIAFFPVWTHMWVL